MRTWETRNCFLWCVGLGYLWAFASLYHQTEGLFGDRGVLPVRAVLRCPSGDVSECGLWGEKPSGLHLLRAWLGVSPSAAMEVAALLGLALASLVLVLPSCRDAGVFAALWFLYFSCFQTGQTFLWFQWDTLLTEVGVLAAVVAPWQLLRGSSVLPHDRVALFLVKWLALRMMFASGVVKLTSECPTWWGLTALDHHFESQCLPTPLAWFAHQSPMWFKKLSVVGTYVIEILIPPLFLLPVRHVRRFAYYSQVLFMISIALSGNYNYFNFLYATICLPLLLDSTEDSAFSTELLRRASPFLHGLAKCFAIGAVYATLVFWVQQGFELRLTEDWTVESAIRFSKEDFYAALSVATPGLMAAGALGLALEVAAALVRCWTDVEGLGRRLWALGSVGVTSLVAVCLFTSSLVPFSYIDETTHKALFPEVRQLHSALEKWEVSHSYGLFRSMTGVGGRPEVVLEGAASESGPWRELEFLYKPGALDKAPPFNAPYQPHLDWQMWFAALGDYRRNPWLLGLVNRLLEDEPSVVRLVTGSSSLRPPPKLIRAQLYHYSFARPASRRPGDWWSRKLQREYMPAVAAGDGQLRDYLRQNGMLVEGRAGGAERPGEWLGRALGLCRAAADSVPGHVFVWAITAAVLAAFVTKRSFASL